jgi:hypothetical protein
VPAVRIVEHIARIIELFAPACGIYWSHQQEHFGRRDDNPMREMGGKGNVERLDSVAFMRCSGDL